MAEGVAGPLPLLRGVAVSSGRLVSFAHSALQLEVELTAQPHLPIKGTLYAVGAGCFELQQKRTPINTHKEPKCTRDDKTHQTERQNTRN